jgi:hypothetical protein
VQSKLNYKLTKVINGVFKDFALEKVANYNQRRSSYRKSVLKELSLNKISNSKLEKKLPKALFINNEIHIPEIGFVMSINNYLDHSFLLNGKIVKVKCIANSECLNDMISKIKSAKYQTNFLNNFLIDKILISTAHAKSKFRKTNDQFEMFLNKNDTKVIAAIMSLKGTFNGADDFNMPLTQCTLYCSNRDNARNSALVLAKVKEHMVKLLGKCDDLSGQYKFKYRTHDYYNDSPINKLIRTVTGDKLLADDKQKDFIDQYLTADQITVLEPEKLAKLNCEKSYTKVNADTDIDDTLENRLAEIQRLLLIIDAENHSNLSLSDPDRQLRQKQLISEREKLKSGDTTTLFIDKAKDFCQVLNKVKSCMQDYYSYKGQSGKVNNNSEIKDLRESITNKLKNRPSGSYVE